MEKDKCQFCLGSKGGVRGNENIFGDIIVCDYCSVLLSDIEKNKESLKNKEIPYSKEARDIIDIICAESSVDQTIKKNVIELDRRYKRVYVHLYASSAHELDMEMCLSNITEVLEAISETDPSETLPRELRDRVFVALGRLKEQRMHYTCPCESCGGKTKIEIYNENKSEE